MSVSPPRPKGPPLNALRAFEAAARLGGFAAAAEELSVTPGAISQHIRSLEDWTGALLFERRSQGVRLTAAGAALLPGFTDAFNQMGQAVRALRALGNMRTLHIAVLPSVAQLWLAPRLPALRAALPGARISISALEMPPNLDREMFDLSLFLREPTGTQQEDILADDWILPVCCPTLAAGIAEPSDLTGHTLLHDAIWAGDWAHWTQAVGCELPDGEDGPQFSLYALAMAEAQSGAGVLMGHEVLVSRALEHGELVAPLPNRVSTGKALVLEQPRVGATRELKHLVAMLKDSV
ncbi:LysR family transcriptional regulator [Roseovarius pelagicus]|uniref:LysR family transcriptional regulator n=1 Tax=Roseovarius pelagicus TaxID=2980108 RepID=A0ABY6DB04_9RHOB|nr:LysR family transcriptional regulator [Roseovarius pelagicus]UXX83342.1 LysR family transcriptional regulator [Roseovarius pelagicus]